MIVQCEQCRTKFRLDDEKVTDRGVKVRCAKCRHVFTVRKEEPAPAQEPAVPVFAAAEAVPATPFVQRPTPSPSLDDVWAPAMKDSAEKTMDSVSAFPAAQQAQPAHDAGAAFDFGAPPLDGPAPDVNFGEISFTETSPALSAANQDDFGLKPAGTAADDTDFGDLALASDPVESVASQADLGETTMMAQQKQPECEVPEEQFVAASSDQDPLPVDSPFDFNEQPKDQSFYLASPSLPDIATKESFQSSANEASPEDSFNMGDIDFGVPADAPSEDSGRQASTTAEEPSAAANAPEITFEAAADREAPPLSIASRRRQSSMLSMLIALLVLLVLGVGGFMAYTSLTDGTGGIGGLFGKPASPAEEGRIFIQKVGAQYVHHMVSGELLVITGEAVNHYSKPRAALQVKGTVFGPGGNTLVSKTAYAGNQLSGDQLATMEMEKIEAAMNNQFGDSLVNLEVPPGKAIPFAIVIVNPPKEGREFGVEAVGSTVAAGK